MFVSVSFVFLLFLAIKWSNMFLTDDVMTRVASGEKRSINPELWHACAGPLVTLPPVGTHVIYFPQGHSEQVSLLLCAIAVHIITIYQIMYSRLQSSLSLVGRSKTIDEYW